MMSTPSEGHSIHCSVDTILLELSADNRFAIGSEGFDGEHKLAVLKVVRNCR